MKQKIKKNHILEARARKNLKQSDLAKVMNVTVGTASRWERQTHQPKMAIAIRLADYFGLDFKKLFEI